MTTQLDSALATRKKCGDCAEGISAPFPFTMAFQPIVDLARRRIYSYEALVRGPGGESAASVLEQVNPLNKYAFDQSCRVTAIQLAARLGIIETGAKLSINFIPGAMYRPEACVRTTLAAAQRAGLTTDKIVLELTENEKIVDFNLLHQIFDVYCRNKLCIAIDDFGAGFAGLDLLARFQPDVLKLDMQLVRGVENVAPRRVIIAALVRIAAELGLELVVEGVETEAELTALRALGVNLVQGYYFAKPAFEALPRVAL
ncbi:MAG: EAL domain-containing protein [Acetobacteraceae bacterium]|nr:EAL domain-containing protein [Acetobacteraceae bacterium]